MNIDISVPKEQIDSTKFASINDGDTFSLDQKSAYKVDGIPMKLGGTAGATLVEFILSFGQDVASMAGTHGIAIVTGLVANFLTDYLNRILKKPIKSRAELDVAMTNEIKVFFDGDRYTSVKDLSEEARNWLLSELDQSTETAPAATDSSDIPPQED